MKVKAWILVSVKKGWSMMVWEPWQNWVELKQTKEKIKKRCSVEDNHQSLLSKFSKPGFNSMWTVSFQMFKLDLEKAEETEIKLLSSVGSKKKQESSRKISTSASLTTLMPLTVWITTNCGKLFKRWEYQTTLPASCKTCMQVKKQQLEPDMEQQMGSKFSLRYMSKLYIVTLLI